MPSTVKSGFKTGLQIPLSRDQSYVQYSTVQYIPISPLTKKMVFRLQIGDPFFLNLDSAFRVVPYVLK
jgi:hypothetical protein